MRTSRRRRADGKCWVAFWADDEVALVAKLIEGGLLDPSIADDGPSICAAVKRLVDTVVHE
jgi:hypothetical protein